MSAIEAGTRVECRNVEGNWFPMIAAGPPRYDDANKIRKVFLTVPVATEAEWQFHGPNSITVNWPAGDVRVKGGPDA